MNYLKTILITTILLNIYNPNFASLFEKEQLPTPDISEEFIVPEETTVIVEEKNELQNWNNHLELLTIEGEYWDATNNVPSDEWKHTAFDLAEKVLKKDTSLAETLKSNFLNAIQNKVTLEKGNQLTKEFNDMIDKLLEQLQEEKKEITVSTPVVSETITPEPVSEPASLPQPEITTAPDLESSSTTQISEQAPKDLQAEWKELLDTIKKEEAIGITLTKVHDVARDLLLAGKYTPKDLEDSFRDAMETRMITKRIDPRVINDEIHYFKTSITRQEQPLYYQPPQMPHQQNQQEVFALQKLQEELDKKDALVREEQEKQRQKEEQERMKLMAAITKAEEGGKVSKAQAHTVITELEKMRRALAQKDAETKQQIKEAREALAKNIEQMAAMQKASAEKGIFSTFTEAVSNWWYGSSEQKPTGLSREDQEKLLNLLPPGAKERFKEFQNKLLSFNTTKFWDQHNEQPNNIWVREIREIIKDLVVQYDIIPLTDISNIIKKVFDSSGKISPATSRAIIENIEQPIRAEIAKQEQEKAIQQQKAEMKKNRKEQLLLAEQKIKDEEYQMEEKKIKEATTAFSYKDEKKQWYNLLDQVAHNKHATPDTNNALTQEAIKKSQTLLNLASDIPTKNKTAISQKLKQRFSLALLDQQKNNSDPVNIYQTMDLFNKEVNKITD